MPDPSPSAYDRYRRGLLTRHVTCAGRYLQQMWLKEPEPSDPFVYRNGHQRQFLTPRIIAWKDKFTFDREPSRAQSDDGPALLSANGRLYLAWSDRTSSQSLSWISTADAANWSERMPIGERSAHSPSLAYFRARIYIAWTGIEADHYLNLMSTADGVHWENRMTFWDEPSRAQSDASPALVAANGRMYIAWSGRSTPWTGAAGLQRGLNWMSSGDGVTWTKRTPIGETSRHSPSLAYFQGRFYIAWTGYESEQNLNLMSSADGLHWGGRIAFRTEPRRACSNDGPFLFAEDRHLHLVWSSREAVPRLQWCSSRNGTDWTPRQVIGGSSKHAPAMSSFSGHPYVAWTGTDDEHTLNIMHASELQAEQELTYIPWVSETREVFGGDDNPLLRGGTLMAALAVEYMVKPTATSLKFADLLLHYFERYEITTADGQPSGFLIKCRNSAFTEEMEQNASTDEMIGVVLGLYHLCVATEASPANAAINTRVRRLMYRIGARLKQNAYLIIAPPSPDLKTGRSPVHRGAFGLFFFQWAFQQAFQRVTGERFVPVQADYDNASRALKNIFESGRLDPHNLDTHDLDRNIQEGLLTMLLWSLQERQPADTDAFWNDQVRSRYRIADVTINLLFGMAPGPNVPWGGVDWLANQTKDPQQAYRIVLEFCADAIYNHLSGGWFNYALVRHTLHYALDRAVNNRARSDDAPALLTANGRLCVAWSGRGSQRRLNWMSTDDGITWTLRTPIGEASEHSPSLAYFQGRFYIAWTGTDDEHHLNVMSSLDGVNWDNKKTFRDPPRRRARSDDGPALLNANGRLYIAWSGRGSQRRLNWMSTADGVNWTERTPIGEASEHSPSLAYFQGRFYIAWTGTDDEHHLNVMSSSDGASWARKRTFIDATSEIAHAASNMLNSLLGNRLVFDAVDNDFYAAVLAKGLVAQFVEVDYMDRVDAALAAREAMWEDLPLGEPVTVRNGSWSAPVRWHNAYSTDALVQGVAKIGKDFCWENHDGFRVLWMDGVPGPNQDDPLAYNLRTIFGMSATYLKSVLARGIDGVIEAGGLDFFFPRVLMSYWLNEPLDFDDVRLHPLTCVCCLPEATGPPSAGGKFRQTKCPRMSNDNLLMTSATI